MVKVLRGGKSKLRRLPRRRSCKEPVSRVAPAIAEIERLLRPLAIERVPTEQLKPNPRNARRHSDRQITQIGASLSEFSFLVPILADENDVLIAGHGRLAAAKQLGLRQVPVIRVDHLTAEQKRAYQLADNRLAELSDWDQDILKLELEELSAADLGFEIEITGFDTVDIDRFTVSTPAPEHDPADILPELDQHHAVSRLGDLWVLTDHRLICGDACLLQTYANLLGGGVAQMVFTDPPYNVPILGHVSTREVYREFPMACGEMSPHEFAAFLEKSFRLMAQHSQDGAIHFACMDWRHLWEMLAAAAPVYGAPKQVCVWAKDNAGMGSFYRSQHEHVFVFKVGDAPHINNFGLGERGRYRTNVWKYPGVSSIGARRAEALEMHPTVKPVALVADAIRDCSRRGSNILDPFGGSGTTLIAAERTGHSARLAELDPLYVDLIVRRWQAYTGQRAVHAQLRHSFDEIATERNNQEKTDA